MKFLNSVEALKKSPAAKNTLAVSSLTLALNRVSGYLFKIELSVSMAELYSPFSKYIFAMLYSA